MSLPKITIVTPSFNQGRFIEQTIRSVLEQGYPNMEYIVMDGGSTDETVDVLKKYDGQLTHWESVKDNGQAHAFNKGFAMAKGDIIGTLNSDDLLLPGALEVVAEQWQRKPDMKWMTGGCILFGEGRTGDHLVINAPETKRGWFLRWCISHPSTFMHRSVLDICGPYDESKYFAMDYEYWMRLTFANIKCHVHPRVMSAFRYHSTSKTVSEQHRRWKDVETITGTYIKKLPEWEQKLVQFLQRRNRGVDDFNTAFYFYQNGKTEQAFELWKSTFELFPEARLSMTRFRTASKMRGLKL